MFSGGIEKQHRAVMGYTRMTKCTERGNKESELAI